jgi:hypothetical protein
VLTPSCIAVPHQTPFSSRRYAKGRQFISYLDQIHALTGPGKWQVLMFAGYLLKLLHR